MLPYTWIQIRYVIKSLIYESQDVKKPSFSVCAAL